MRLAFEHIFHPSADKADVAGSALYIGAVGSMRTRVFLSKKFSRFSEFFDQRAALIAVHELPWAIVKENVAPHVLPELIGVYKKLHGSDNYQGVYVLGPAAVSASELFDALGSDHVS
jgi:hypothetical protein